MNTTKTITLDVKAVNPVSKGEPAWDVKILAKEGTSPLKGFPIGCASHTLNSLEDPPTKLSPDLVTDADGEAECRLVEPPESQTHGPGLWLEAETDGNTVTFRIAAYEDQPLSGVRVEFRCPDGTLEPAGTVTTGDDGKAEYRLNLT